MAEITAWECQQCGARVPIADRTCEPCGATRPRDVDGLLSSSASGDEPTTEHTQSPHPIDTPPGHGYWKASDGNWYPPEAAPGAAAEAPLPRYDVTPASPKEPRSWKTWQLLTAAGLALLLGVGIGAAGGSGSADTRLAAAEADKEAAQKNARERIDAAEEEVTRAKSAALAAEEQARAKLATEVAGKEAEAAARQAELDAKAAAVARREQAVTGAETAAKANEFASGVHRVGVDIQPGRYRAQAVDTCYWAKLRENDSIIDNHLQNEPGVVNVTIEPSVYKFETTGCGTWRKVG